MDLYTAMFWIACVALILGGVQAVRELPAFLKRPPGVQTDSGIKVLWIFRWVLGAALILSLVILLYFIVQGL